MMKKKVDSSDATTEDTSAGYNQHFTQSDCATQVIAPTVLDFLQQHTPTATDATTSNSIDTDKTTATSVSNQHVLSFFPAPAPEDRQTTTAEGKLLAIVTATQTQMRKDGVSAKSHVRGENETPRDGPARTTEQRLAADSASKEIAVGGLAVGVQAHKEEGLNRGYTRDGTDKGADGTRDEVAKNDVTAEKNGDNQDDGQGTSPKDGAAVHATPETAGQGRVEGQDGAEADTEGRLPAKAPTLNEAKDDDDGASAKNRKNGVEREGEEKEWGVTTQDVLRLSMVTQMETNAYVSIAFMCTVMVAICFIGYHLKNYTTKVYSRRRRPYQPAVHGNV
ncbi:hypothetical protein, variant [Sphaeroforma arctica JP610]|nr:hypothetical protein, variant [Sphaeroforma arctica JP610]KNC78426.1 hypothetical protein, variant [Sphaeroforma arctica JP610]|eukprot:XP_014152328.1 hypothetical protein, variant [Sphaeroforma arctica JP610]